MSCYYAGLMISISSTGFWIGVVVVNEISPILVSSSLRLSGTVLLFAGINLLVFMFILLVVPETKVSYSSLSKELA